MKPFINMKHIIITIALALTTFGITSCNTNKVNEYELTCNVKSYTIKTYEIVSKFGEYCKGDINSSFESTNAIFEFTKDGLLKSKSDLEIRHGNFTGEIGGKDIYKYNKNNELISEHSYYSNGSLMSYTLYEYDISGHCICEKYYYNDNSLRWTVTYTYDNDRIIKLMHDEEPNIPDFGVFKKKIHESDYEITYVYDDNGKHIKNIIHDFKTCTQEEKTYEYVFGDTNVEVNEYGLVTKIDELTFEYTYDNHHNWITKTTYKNTIPISIIERDIIY